MSGATPPPAPPPDPGGPARGAAARLRGLAATPLLRHAAVLFGGNAGASALGVVSLAVTARALGPQAFGILVLVQTFVTVVDLLAGFQAWQAVIGYGAGMLEQGRRDHFRDLLKLSLVLDAAGAVVGAAAAIVGGYLVARWNGWDEGTARLAALYGGVVLFNFTGTAIGVLRLFDRYALFTVPQLAGALTKLVLATVAWRMRLGLPVFLLAWMLGTLVQYLLLAALAWRELRRRDPGALAGNARRALRTSPGILGFVVSTKLQGAVRIGSREVDTLLVGWMLGTAAAGLYKVVKQFASVMGQLTDPFYQAVYPQLARTWSRGDRGAFGRTVRGSVAAGGAAGVAVWVAFVALGPWILRLTVGAEFAGAYPVLVWYMAGTALSVATFALLPATLAMGMAGASLRVLLASTALYLALLALLLPAAGLWGAGPAYLCFYLAWSAGMGLVITRGLRRGGAPAPAAGVPAPGGA